MAGNKDLMKTETVATMAKSDPSMELAGKDLTNGEDGVPFDSSFSAASSGHAASSLKGETDDKSVGEHGPSYPPTSCYNSYFYPGYSGSITQTDGYCQADGSNSGMQSDDGSLVYYLPGYATGTFVRFDGQYPVFSSSGYIQHPVSYGSEAVPFYSWDSTFVRDVQNGNSTTSGMSKTCLGFNASVKSNGVNSAKTSGNVSSKFSKPIPRTHPLKSLNKAPPSVPGFSYGFLKGDRQLGRSSFHNQKQGSFLHNDSVNDRQNVRLWSGNDRFRDKPSKNIESSEITRGPRVNNSSAPSGSPAVKDLGLTLRRNQYNQPDFKTEYENAKFYVIKSFSEDDVHKCIMFDVWSSTANGNRKLDAAFHDAEARTSESGTKCPLFLFFSVNASGQFIGCAEMIGKVDFNKDMDFWQLDKWNGFFPVKWHIVKDIPNSRLRHIILENNDNREVTYSRDTQEIGLKQGLEMLKIFKNYSARTSLLDDFNFYEAREKAGRAKKSGKPATQQNEIYKDVDSPHKHSNALGRKPGRSTTPQMMMTSDPTCLVNLTRKLSLNAGECKSSV